MKYHLAMVRMPIIKKKKKLHTMNASESMEKRERSSTVGRSIN